MVRGGQETFAELRQTATFAADAIYIVLALEKLIEMPRNGTTP